MAPSSLYLNLMLVFLRSSHTPSFAAFTCSHVPLHLHAFGFFISWRFVPPHLTHSLQPTLLKAAALACITQEKGLTDAPLCHPKPLISNLPSWPWLIWAQFKNIGGDDKQRGCHSGAHGNQGREELSVILTHILGKSLWDAGFDHYHFPSVCVLYEHACVNLLAGSG